MQISLTIRMLSLHLFQPVKPKPQTTSSSGLQIRIHLILCTTRCVCVCVCLCALFEKNSTVALKVVNIMQVSFEGLKFHLDGPPLHLEGQHFRIVSCHAPYMDPQVHYDSHHTSYEGLHIHFASRHTPLVGPHVSITSYPIRHARFRTSTLPVAIHYARFHTSISPVTIRHHVRLHQFPLRVTKLPCAIRGSVRLLCQSPCTMRESPIHYKYYTHAGQY